MDPPDATSAGDRELLNPTPTPPMRPDRRSDPNNDPTQGQSHVYHVVITGADDETTVPASSGIAFSHIQEIPDLSQLSYTGGLTAAPPNVTRPPDPALHLAPNDGHVFRGEGRLQVDFERVIDRRYSLAHTDGSTHLDRGYVTGSYLSPPTVGQPGRGKEQQFVSVHTMYGGQLAHTYPVVTEVDVGIEPLTLDSSMSLARCQSAAI